MLATPASAASHWVQREISWWLTNRSVGSLFIVLLEGTIAWDPEAQDFDFDRTDALPASVSGAWTEEPLWVDLLWAASISPLSSGDPRFQDAVATLAAPMHGWNKDQLIGEDLRAHRRSRRLAMIVIAALTALVIAVSVAVVVALRQGDAAQEQATVAESRALAASALTTAQESLDTALLLADEGVRTRSSPATESALLQTVATGPQLLRFLPTDSAVSAVVGMPGGGVVVGTDDGAVTVWKNNLETAAHIVVGTAPVTGLAVDPRGLTIVALDADRGVTAVDAPSGRKLWHITASAQADAAAVSPDLSAVAIVDARGKLSVLRGATRNA